MGHYRDILAPLFEQVFQDALQQCTAAEQELRAAARTAFHRINLADRRFDALRKRATDLAYQAEEEAEEGEGPLYELLNEVEDGLGPPDLSELRGLMGDAMKQIRQMVRDLEKQRRAYVEIIADIRE